MPAKAVISVVEGTSRHRLHHYSPHRTPAEEVVVAVVVVVVGWVGVGVVGGGGGGWWCRRW